MTPWAHRVLEVGSLVNKLQRWMGAISRSPGVLNGNLRSYKIKVSNKELFLYTYVCIYMCVCIYVCVCVCVYFSAQVLVVTCEMFSCSIGDPVPCLGIEHRPPALGASSFRHDH